MREPPELPSAYRKIYKDFYLDYASSNTFFRKLSQKLEAWYHFKIGRESSNASRILEVGAGSLSHILYEQLSNDSIYDIVEPKTYLVENSSTAKISKVRNIYSSLDEIPVGEVFDKIISIATIEHIWELENHLKLISEKLDKAGFFYAAIPAEGEFLWWVAWRLTTGVGFWLKYKLDYGTVMRYEHVNNAHQIILAIKKHFKIVKITSFPIQCKHLRLFIYIKMSRA